MHVEFTLIGTKALLMHRDNIEGGDRLKEWRQKTENKNVSVPGDDRSPPWTWQTYLYDDEEKVVIPHEYVMGALMTGGTQIILKKQKSFKELSQSGIVMDDEYLDFEYADGRTLYVEELDAMKDLPFAQQSARCREMGFELLTKRARVGQTKHVRVRPRFDRWKVIGSMNVHAKEITFEVLEQMFAYAGNAGIGDWRPSSPRRPGPYGQFTAKLKRG